MYEGVEVCIVRRYGGVHVYEGMEVCMCIKVWRCACV